MRLSKDQCCLKGCNGSETRADKNARVLLRPHGQQRPSSFSCSSTRWRLLTSLILDIKPCLLCHRPCPSPLPASNIHHLPHHLSRAPIPYLPLPPHLDHGVSSDPTSPLPARALSFSTSSAYPCSCSTAKRTSTVILVVYSLTRVGRMSGDIVCGGGGRRTCFGVRG